MQRLLADPIVFSDGTPIWWWRGHANLQIESFKHLNESIYLMNGDELNISRIAAIAPGPYNRCFVYVETAPMPPTGLYEGAAERIAQVERGEGYFPYYHEEYGLVDGVLMVRREEVDDGAAEINGRIEDIRGRNELRSRYVTPYNFLIAPHNSPINNNSFDEIADQMLTAMLKGQDLLDDLMKLVLTLPLCR